MRNAAVKAGAKFIVSPGFDTEIVNYCLEKEIPIFLGCVTPPEVAQAVKRGLKVVKFFPAEPAGGLKYIRAIAAPYTMMKFMPTGGINPQNVREYLAYDRIAACGGSWMVKKDLVAAGEFDKIRDLTKEAVQTMLGFELAHIGINCDSEAEAEKTADAFDGLFGFTKKVGNSSVFAGKAVEAMKSKGLGAKGHIAVATNSVVRAKNYLEMMGYKFNEESAKFKGDKMTAIYLADEIGGFAVHLVQK